MNFFLDWMEKDFVFSPNFCLLRKLIKSKITGLLTSHSAAITATCYILKLWKSKTHLERNYNTISEFRKKLGFCPYQGGGSFAFPNF